MREIRKTFPGVIALDHVNFDLVKGEVHVLLGENGAGKSTLMKILSGAYQKTSGHILLESREVEIRSPRHAQELGISTIYQELNLIPQLSVAENIFLGREPIRFSSVIDKKRLIAEAQELLDMLGVSLSARSLIAQLSIAEQQMVEVAKALSWSAKILIMDEPTSALSDHEITNLFATIRRLKEDSVAIIYISHRLEELFEIGDRVTVLRDSAQVGTRNVAETSKDELIQMMVDRPLTEQYPKKAAVHGEEILRLDNLSNSRLRSISFSLKRGEVLGIAGLMGCGRTDLTRAIFGLAPIDSGQIFIRNQPQKIRSPKHAINLGIGFLTEDRKSQGLILILSVKENIVLSSMDRLSRFGIVDLREEAKVARRFADSLRIKTPGVQHKVMLLSGGNQQKVVLSKWLCSQADILMFDEPTRGIDVATKVEIYQLMNEMTSKGAAIMMISSDLPEILGMSDRILVMHRGHITSEFDRSTATQEKIMQAALGEARVN
ncbi:sugar ABC transporter ATP-binding protein [bacterium]|nr:sugar ABC transporter ATP-binding protein [bacterium]